MKIIFRYYADFKNINCGNKHYQSYVFIEIKYFAGISDIKLKISNLPTIILDVIIGLAKKFIRLSRKFTERIIWLTQYIGISESANILFEIVCLYFVCYLRNH